MAIGVERLLFVLVSPITCKLTTFLSLLPTPTFTAVPQPPPDLSVQVVNSSGESTLFLVEFTHHLDFARECELVYFKTSSGADTQGGLASLPGEFVPQGDTMVKCC